MELGQDGVIAFKSKTRLRLMMYYINDVGAVHFGGGLMVIEESVVLILEVIDHEEDNES